MNKKFLSVTLFSALMIGATGTFTSCKDYDDDIKNLQEQLDKKASLEELAAKVSQTRPRTKLRKLWTRPVRQKVVFLMTT